MVDMEEDIEEDMVEDTGDDLSDNINSLSAFDFSNSCILSSPGFGCLLLNPIQGGGQKPCTPLFHHITVGRQQ